jgi:hypothetical protein
MKTMQQLQLQPLKQQLQPQQNQRQQQKAQLLKRNKR